MDLLAATDRDPPRYINISLLPSINYFVKTGVKLLAVVSISALGLKLQLKSSLAEAEDTEDGDRRGSARDRCIREDCTINAGRVSSADGLMTRSIRPSCVETVSGSEMEAPLASS